MGKNPGELHPSYSSASFGNSASTTSGFAARARAKAQERLQTSRHAVVADELSDLLKKERIPPAAAEELRSIGQNPNPLTFWEELFQFGVRLVDQKKDAAAAGVFAFIRERGEEVPEGVRLQAKAEGEALAGVGHNGRRWGYQFSRFADQVSDYRMIVPALVGSTVFNLARTTMLGRLAGTTGGAWQASKLGSRLTANAFALGLEVPTFSLLSRSLHQLSGEKVAWDDRSVGKDLFGTSLVLGLLKFSGWSGNKIVGARQLAGAPTLIRSLVPQATSFLGLYGAHHLQVGFGLQPEKSGATLATDTLASLVSLGIGAHLGTQLLGPAFANFNRELALRSEWKPPVSSGKNIFQTRAQSVPSSVAISSRFSPDRWNILAMTGKPEDEGSGTSLPVSPSTGFHGSKKIPAPEPVHTPIPQANRRTLAKRIHSVLQDDAEAIRQYEEALAQLAKKGGHRPAMIVVDRRMQSDPEDGLDLLLAFRDLTSHQKPAEIQMTGEKALRLVEKIPHLLGPALRLIHALAGSPNWIGWDPKSQIENVFDGAQLLFQFQPDIAESILENLAADSLVKPRNLERPLTHVLLQKLLRIKKQVPLQADSILKEIGPLLERDFKRPWGGVPFYLNHRLDLAENMVLLLDHFLSIPDRPAEIRRLVESILQKPEVEPLYRGFHSVYERGDVPKTAMIESWDAIVKEKGTDGIQTILDYYRTFSLLLPEKLAARLVVHPEFFSALKKEEDFSSAGSFLLPLLDISFTPEIEDRFHAFIQNSQGTRHLGPLFRYIETFGELAWTTMEGQEIPEESDAKWERMLPKDLSEEGRRDFFALLAEDPNAPSGSQALEAAALPFDLPAGIFEKYPHAPGFQEDPRMVVESNHDLILKQNQIFLKLTRREPQSRRTFEVARHILQSLERLPIRGVINQWFHRMDLALNIHRVAGFEKESAPDLSPLLAKDLDELMSELGDMRGISFGRWIVRMHRQGFPARVPMTERILQAAVTPPPRQRLNAAHPSGERAVLETLRSLMTPRVQEVLEQIPLSEKGRRLAEKIKGMAARYEQSKNSPEDADLLQGIEALFFGGPSEKDLETLEASELVLPKPEAPLLTAGEPTSPHQEKAPDPKAPSTALAKVLTEGGLTVSKMSPNPRTGMMEIDLGGGAKMGIWHAVAPVRSEDATELRRDWNRRIGGEYHKSTRDQLSKLDREYFEQKNQALVPQAASTAIELASRLEAVRQADSIQMMMGFKLGENPEEVMLNKIAAAMSIRQGLDILELALRRGNGNSILSFLKGLGKIDPNDENFSLESVRTLNVFSPNVTTLEVALASLAEEAPKVLLDHEGVPMPYRILVSGIEWANDDYDPSRHRQGLFPTDPYQYIGVTGAGLTTQFTHFTTWVTRMIQGTLKTQLKDRELFNHLFRWQGGEADMAGLNMLKNTGDPRRLLNKEVMDVDYDRKFIPSHVTRLIGLLEKVPQCLNTEQPARIYFKPFAGGVIFLNVEGQPVEYVSYHPHLQRIAFQEVHYKTESDMTDDNAMAHQFLGDKLTTKLFEAGLEQTEGESSILEDAVLDFSTKFKVALPLPTRSTKNILAGDDLAISDARSIKMGVLEVFALDRALGSMHPLVWARAREGRDGKGSISVIRKNHATEVSLMDWSRRADVLGEYSPFDRSITLYHLQEQPYARLDEVGRQIWHDTVLHEVGEALYESLSQEEREAFAAVYPWRTGVPGAEVGALIPSSLVVVLVEDPLQKFELTPAFPEKEIGRHLLTSYSSSNPRDLFCEAFMAYIAHGPEFRARAVDSPYLQKLYEVLKSRIFVTPEGPVEYTDSPAVSLKEIEENVRRWRNEMRRKGQKEKLELSHEEAMEEVIGKFVESPEEVEDQHWAEERERAAREVEEEGGFVGAYYAMAMLDEAGQRARAIRPRPDPFVVLPEWEQPVVKAMAKALKVDIFGSLRVPTQDFAMQIWDLMSRGKKDRILEKIRNKIERVAKLFDEDQFETDEEEIFHLLVEVAAGEMAGPKAIAKRISQTLSDFVLPGQYVMKDIEEIGSVPDQVNFTDLQIIRRIYDYVSTKRNWHLQDEAVAQLTGHLAVDLTWVGRQLGHKRLTGVMQSLQGKSFDLYSIAKQYGMKPGEIDAFAEKFLDAKAYRELQSRSEREGLKLNLETSLGIHLALQAEWKEYFPNEALPQELQDGIARIESALSSLEKNDADSLAEAKKILSDRKHSSDMDEVARGIFQQAKTKD